MEYYTLVNLYISIGMSESIEELKSIVFSLAKIEGSAKDYHTRLQIYQTKIELNRIIKVLEVQVP